MSKVFEWTLNSRSRKELQNSKDDWRLNLNVIWYTHFVKRKGKVFVW